MKQRRKQPETTRKAILQAAGRGFAEVGYAATGIGEIADQSGLTRGALFHHFHDKQGLAVCWIDEELRPAMRRECIEPLHAVHGFREWKDLWLRLIRALENGHPVSMLHLLGAEWARDATLGAAINALLDDWLAEVATALENGQKAGWIHRSIQARSEAGLLVAQLCGAALMVRLAGDVATVKARYEQSASAYLETMRGD